MSHEWAKKSEEELLDEAVREYVESGSDLPFSEWCREAYNLAEETELLKMEAEFARKVEEWLAGGERT